MCVSSVVLIASHSGHISEFLLEQINIKYEKQKRCLVAAGDVNNTHTYLTCYVLLPLKNKKVGHVKVKHSSLNCTGSEVKSLQFDSVRRDESSLSLTVT